MKEFHRKYAPFIWGIVAGILIVGAQVIFATDWTRTYDVVLGVDSPKSAIVKLESEDIEIYTLLNALKDGNAGTAAPASPNEGEFWFDTDDGEGTMKQYHASTWDSLWRYLDTTTLEWIGNVDAVAATIDSLESSDVQVSPDMTSITASVVDTPVIISQGDSSVLATDIHAGSLQEWKSYAGAIMAEVDSTGAFSIQELKTANWTQDTATFNTLNATTIVNPVILDIEALSAWEDTITFEYPAPWHGAFIGTNEYFQDMYNATMAVPGYVEIADGETLQWFIWDVAGPRIGVITIAEISIPCAFADGAGDSTLVDFAVMAKQVADHLDDYNFSATATTVATYVPSAGLFSTFYRDADIDCGEGLVDNVDTIWVEVDNGSGETLRCGKPFMTLQSKYLITYF